MRGSHNKDVLTFGRGSREVHVGLHRRWMVMIICTLQNTWWVVGNEIGLVASVGWTTSVCARRLITGGNQKWLGNFTICHLIHNPITIYHSAFQILPPKTENFFHSMPLPTYPSHQSIRSCLAGWMTGLTRVVWNEEIHSFDGKIWKMFELSGKSCEGRWWQIVKFIWEALAAISVVTGNFLLE